MDQSVKLCRLHTQKEDFGFDTKSYGFWKADIFDLVHRIADEGWKPPKVLVEFKMRRRAQAMSTEDYAEHYDRDKAATAAGRRQKKSSTPPSSTGANDAGDVKSSNRGKKAQ